MDKKTDAFQTIDLFCGCGGLTDGMAQAGFICLAGFDNWQPAIDVYNENLLDTAEKLDLSDLPKVYKRLDQFDSFDGLIGGPPCQDFSSAGKRIEGHRANLTVKFATIVNHYKPIFFLMENVATAGKAAAHKEALEMLSKAGYGITKQVLDASRCGCPQARKRLITVGFLNANKDNSFEDYITRDLSDRQMTMNDYFEGGLSAEAFCCDPKIPVPEGGTIEGYYRHPRTYDRRAVFSMNEPSPTIRGVNRPQPANYKSEHNHRGNSCDPDKVQALTTAVRARIQTFEKNCHGEPWVWKGSKADQEQMIGNAVPVNLAKYVGKAIKAYLDELSESQSLDQST